MTGLDVRQLLQADAVYRRSSRKRRAKYRALKKLIKRTFRRGTSA